MPRIESMYAFIAEDSGPDDEGVIGMHTGAGWVPLVAADMARVESLRPFAASIARTTRKPVKLVHFTQRQDIEIIR